MTAVLHKGSTGTAREASLALALPRRAEMPPVPDERDIEIARLEAERDDLRKRLAAAERCRDEELRSIEAAARQAAANEFRQDDARRLDLLTEALNGGRASFETGLVAALRDIAPRLAGQALEQLVRIEDTEAQWLARAIDRRLDDLQAQTVVSLHVAATDWSEALVDRLGDRLPDGAVLSRDGSLQAGSARIMLRLGEVEIDAAAGLARLMSALGEEGGEGD